MSDGKIGDLRDRGVCNSKEQLESDIRSYAREVFREYDLGDNISHLIEWKASGRLTRTSTKINGTKTNSPVAKVSWIGYKNKGWEFTKACVRWAIAAYVSERGDYDSNELHRRLDTHHAKENVQPPKYIVQCKDCGVKYKRYKKGKLIKNTEMFCCGECDGDNLEVIHDNSDS